MREKEDKDHAFHELKLMEKRQKEAIENEEKAYLKVNEMEKKVANMATNVSSMEKRIKQVNAQEEQLFAKEKEHEMLVKAYIERKMKLMKRKNLWTYKWQQSYNANVRQKN